MGRGAIGIHSEGPGRPITVKDSGASRNGDETLWAREEATEATKTLRAEGGGQLILGEVQHVHESFKKSSPFGGGILCHHTHQLWTEKFKDSVEIGRQDE